MKEINWDKKSKFKPLGALGHAGSLIGTGMSIKGGMDADKAFKQELAERGIKDNRNWVSRNAKALTSTLGATAGSLASNYITRKTGLNKSNSIVGQIANAGVGYGVSTLGSKLADMPLKKYRERQLNKMQSEQEKSPNWFKRNKKLLIGAGIAAGGIGAGILAGKHIAKKVNEGGKLKDYLDNKSVTKSLENNMKIHKWDKGMTKEVFKDHFDKHKEFLKGQKGYLDNRVKERMMGYGAAIGGAVAAGGAYALAKKDPEVKQQSDYDTLSGFILKKLSKKLINSTY